MLLVLDYVQPRAAEEEFKGVDENKNWERCSVVLDMTPIIATHRKQ